ncbi:lysine N(6)-hydroxylase/L-ornithine N(5)-oxygenase family protein [Janthinobacterium lividum]|uniref:Alcaligin biosynthesis protein n=1 Tax=Janthinobacterium lividum TaxID=29581 RepID=A0A1E8PV04_9BURK|nr:alcaligin biosynthesis protein [Janthinobacterium lividum]
MQLQTYDFIAIGLGPFNLSLACLTEPLTDVNALFLDQVEQFEWHAGMMLPNATLQTPFMADLVTLADPTSPFSFLNYAKTQGRLYSFYIKESFFLMRNEYNAYCQWALAQLSNVRLGNRVERVEYDAAEALYLVHSRDLRSGQICTYRAHKLVLGTGTSPFIPECCRHLGVRARHAASYLRDKASLQRRRSITIIGSGQSAAEIYYDLLQDIDRCGYQLNWLTRSPRFYPLEYSKLTLEMTSPDYIDYFHALPATKRDQLIRQQHGLYKGINLSLINDIFDLLYNKRLNGDIPTRLLTNADLRFCHYDEVRDRYDMVLRQTESGQDYQQQSEALVLATGYHYQLPEFLAPIRSRLRWDEKKRLDVARNYSVDHAASEVFVQNVGLYSHGLSTPDLGMACYRNATIVREITGVEHYAIEQRIAFQQFALPLGSEVIPEEARAA